MLLFEALQSIDSIKKNTQEQYPNAKEPIKALDVAEKAITAQIRLSEMFNSWWDDLREGDSLSAQAAYEILNTIRFDFEPAEAEEDQEKEKTHTAVGVILETCDDICRNFCKYAGTENDEAECEWIREGNECPLDRLQ